MSRSKIGIALGIATILQVFLLVGMLAKAAMPLWTGTEVRVKTIPVDPRSLFRGNYARLNYEFGTLPADVPIDANQLGIGVVVYVQLRAENDGLYRYAGATLEKPHDGIYLRGRISSNYSPYQVLYGIEAFFAPKQKALQLERELRSSGVAVLMVSSGGQAALKDIVPDAAER